MRLPAPAAGDDGYTGPRELGTDPESGLAVTLRRGPAGWYVQRGGGKSAGAGGAAAGGKPERMSLPATMEPGTVDLELARRLLALRARPGCDFILPKLDAEATLLQ